MIDNTDETDDLNELLSPLPAEETAGLRDAIFHRTQRRLAFTRWTRKAVKTAAIAAVFAGGIAVGAWIMPRERETVLVPMPVPQPVPIAVLVPVPSESAEQRPQVAQRTARDFELNAEQADDAQIAAKFYRQAGDAYLNAEQDYANAARCYRLFLARADDTALSPEPSDSWLLTSLKNAAFKEKVYATPSNG